MSSLLSRPQSLARDYFGDIWVIIKKRRGGGGGGGGGAQGNPSSTSEMTIIDNS